MKNKIFKIVISLWHLLPFKKQFRNILNLDLFKTIKSKLYKDLRYNGVFEIQYEEVKFKLFNPGFTTIENEIFWNGIAGWEYMTFKTWKRLAFEAKCIVDIGANTGVFSLVAAGVNPNAITYSYEPVKRTAEIFKKNMKLNSNFHIKLSNKAISNNSGICKFYDVDSPSQYSASLNPEMLKHLDNTLEYNVSVTTLDNELNSQVDLIKLDVEMHEYEALQGMENIILNYRPSLIIEILTEELREKIFDFLSKFNYRIFNIDNERGLVENKYEKTYDNRNYLFIQNDKIKLISELIC